MKCNRLIGLTKTWYLHVKDETMAPARMIQFMKNHAATCEICLSDADLSEEIEKITELILPESKIPKAVRLQSDLEDDEEFDEDLDEDLGEDDDGLDSEDSEDSEEEEEEYMDDDDDDLEDEDLKDLD